jgi:hypothetical protein
VTLLGWVDPEAVKQSVLNSFDARAYTVSHNILCRYHTPRQFAVKRLLRFPTQPYRGCGMPGIRVINGEIPIAWEFSVINYAVTIIVYAVVRLVESSGIDQFVAVVEVALTH